MIQALEEMITLLYPRRCPLCQDILTDKAALICMKCRTKAVPIRGPKCKTCGKPVASLETEYCPDCQEKTHFLHREGLFFSMKKKSGNLYISLNFTTKENMPDFMYRKWSVSVEMRSAPGIGCDHSDSDV